MTSQTIEELKTLLINAGYKKELNDILFIEDIEPLDFELIDLDNLGLDLDSFNFDDLGLNFDFEPIEFD